MKIDNLELYPINWEEVQQFVDGLEIVRDDEPGWDSVIPSPDGKYEVWYKWAGSVGPKWSPLDYYNIRITIKQTDTVVWEAENRHFSSGDIEHHTPWMYDSAKLALIEWHNEQPNQKIVIMDVETGREQILGRSKEYLTLRFLPLSSPCVVVEGKEEIKCWFLDRPPTKLGQIGHYTSAYERHIRLLIADSPIPNCLLVCNQVETSRLELINVIEKNVVRSWELTPNIFEKTGHHESLPNDLVIDSSDKTTGKLWGILLWDAKNSRHLLGVRRATRHGINYCRVYEWLELRLEV